MVAAGAEHDGNAAASRLADNIQEASWHAEPVTHEEGRDRGQEGAAAATEQQHPSAGAAGGAMAIQGHEYTADMEEGHSDPGPKRPQQAEESAQGVHEHAGSASSTLGAGPANKDAGNAPRQQQDVAGAAREQHGDEKDHEAEPVDETAEAAKLADEREAALERMPSLLPATEGQFSHEQPRPVVTYMSRNFFR